MVQEPISWQHRSGAFFEEEAAASATEYAILLAMLVLGSVGVIRSIGTSFRGVYLAIAAKIPDA